jgi:rhodanese-related sulfurtransferase/TusA-related sulfurtransferase
VLGAQAIGYGGVDKRIDVIATAIKGKMTVDDLCEIEHAYAPPYSSAKDPVNMAGFAAQNFLEGLVRSITWDELPAAVPQAFLVDVRTPEEYATGTIGDAVNIPVDSLRERLGELPKNKPLIIFCRVGLRGYIATRILSANGFNNCSNLSGGYETWRVATEPQTVTITTGPNTPAEIGRSEVTKGTDKIIEINACGLQCPGPVMRLKEEMDSLAPGEALLITASDPGFYNDAQAWARATGNSVRDIRINKGIVTATIEKGARISAPAASA